MRDKVRAYDYIMTPHARIEMVDDGLFIEDVDRIILTGEIVERQKDHLSSEWKYVIEGQTEAYERGYVVAKLDLNDDLVIITVYVE
ncbi:MAG: DUF4258 domain-containing protein [Ardenticatenaceae bacterium]